jgi:hypothetical protein
VGTDPLELRDDFAAVVARVRDEIAATAEDKAPTPGEYVSPLGPAESDATVRLLWDGTYRRAADRIGEQDPDLADE